MNTAIDVVDTPLVVQNSIFVIFFANLPIFVLQLIYTDSNQLYLKEKMYDLKVMTFTVRFQVVRRVKYKLNKSDKNED